MERLLLAVSIAFCLSLCGPAALAQDDSMKDLDGKITRILSEWDGERRVSEAIGCILSANLIPGGYEQLRMAMNDWAGGLTRDLRSHLPVPAEYEELVKVMQTTDSFKRSKTLGAERLRFWLEYAKQADLDLAVDCSQPSLPDWVMNCHDGKVKDLELCGAGAEGPFPTIVVGLWRLLSESGAPERQLAALKLVEKHLNEKRWQEFANEG